MYYLDNKCIGLMFSHLLEDLPGFGSKIIKALNT